MTGKKLLGKKKLLLLKRNIINNKLNDINKQLYLIGTDGIKNRVYCNDCKPKGIFFCYFYCNKGTEYAIKYGVM